MLNLGDIIIGSIRQTLSLARSYGWRGSRPETGGYGRPLHQAAEAGDVSTALAMLHSGAAVNERDELAGRRYVPPSTAEVPGWCGP